jgi:site-specific DNA-methyltransferase (cytosine-N4-specific)
VEAHPARFPEKLPAFFIDFLTDPRDLVLDFFAGSNTAGVAAEKAGRRWLAFDSCHEYLAASVFRFVGDLPPREALAFYRRLVGQPEVGVRVPVSQEKLALSYR